jgi:hypothetical protein
VAAFKFSERSPLPPTLTAKDLPGGQTQILNFHRIRRMNCHPVESDKDFIPESISPTENWLNWNGNLENPNDSEVDCVADFESNIEHYSGIEDPACPAQQNVSAVPNIPRLIWPTHKSKRLYKKGLLPINTIEMQGN